MTTTAESQLSGREAEVLALLGARLSNTQIAGRLHVSVRTVEGHVSLLLRKYALHGSPEQARAELTAHLQVGAAELQRLLDLLAQRKELAHRKEREAPRG